MCALMRPTGNIEAGEEAEAAALRELREETSIHSVRVLQAPENTFEYTLKYDRGGETHVRMKWFLVSGYSCCSLAIQSHWSHRAAFPTESCSSPPQQIDSGATFLVHLQSGSPRWLILHKICFLRPKAAVKRKKFVFLFPISQFPKQFCPNYQNFLPAL